MGREVGACTADERNPGYAEGVTEDKRCIRTQPSAPSLWSPASGTDATSRRVSLDSGAALPRERDMITVAELRSMEGHIVAVARGLTAQLRCDGSATSIHFESVTGAQALVRVDPRTSGDVASLCPATLEETALTDAA